MPSSLLHDNGPSRLSSAFTCCSASGVIVEVSILCPTSGKVRPAHDISFALSGGPTDCDARLAKSMLIVVAAGPLPRFSNTLAAVSRSPNGLTPLKRFCARLSQKFRLLNMALIIVGVLRGSARRTLMLPTLKPSVSSTDVQLSKARKSNGTEPIRPPGLAWMLVKVRLNTPAEDHTSLLSRTTVDRRLFGSASLWSGKSPAEMV